jgi:hypothetical protein
MEENKKKDEIPVNAPEEKEIKNEKKETENVENKVNPEDVENTENVENTEKAENTVNPESSQTKTQTPEEDKRYNVITELPKNLWTYGSPIIFESGVLERDNISKKNRLTLNFTNIYPSTIKNVDITVFASDEEGNTEQVEHQYVALGQKYLTSKGSAAKLHIKNETAKKFVIKVNSVEFEDGSYWSKEDAVYESTGDIENLETFAEAKAKDYEDNYVTGTEEVGKDDSLSIGNGIERELCGTKTHLRY